MSKIADLSSMGYWPMRHEENIADDIRNVVYGLRFVKQDENTAEETTEDYGDIQFSHYWKALKGRRFAGSWSWATPAYWDEFEARPILNDDLAEDIRYEKDSVTSVVDHDHPKGMPGVVLAASDETSEEKLFFPAMGDLIAHHSGADVPDYSSLVYDINADRTIDYLSGAGLHSHLWVKKIVPGLNALAWNLTASTGDKTGFGLYTALAGQDAGVSRGTVLRSKNPAIMAYASHEMYGPFHPGSVEDNHKIANSLSGPINSGHLSFNSYFYVNTSYDAPLDFEVEDHPHTQEGVFPYQVHLQYDKDDFHGHVTGIKKGKWRWHVKLPTQYVEPPDPVIPRPIDWPPPWIQYPPINPLPPLSPKKPGKGKDGKPQPKKSPKKPGKGKDGKPQPKKSPKKPGKGKDGKPQPKKSPKKTPEGEGFPIGNGPIQPGGPVLPPEWDRPPKPVHKIVDKANIGEAGFWKEIVRKVGAAIDKNFQSRSRGILHSVQKQMVPGFAVQAQPARNQEEKEKYKENPSQKFIDRATNDYPAVGQFEGYGHEIQPGHFKKTPGRRYRMGTGSGGTVYLPPELSMGDHLKGFAPAGVDISETHFTLLNDHVHLSWGLPDPTLGRPVSGFKITNESTQYLSSRQFDSSGDAIQTGYLDLYHNMSVRGSTAPGIEVVNTTVGTDTNSGTLKFFGYAAGADGSMSIRQESDTVYSNLAIYDPTGTKIANFQATTGNFNIGGGSTGKAIMKAFQMTTSPTSGYVLTSDASGNGTWQAPSGGDVVGPASATDNALARFDGTTGKLLQNSVGILTDAGALSGLTGLSTSAFQLTTGPSAGYILQSDVSGNASWVAGPTSSTGWTASGGKVYLTTLTDNVSIGNNSPGAKLHIDGDTDEIQAIIEGHSTQTSDFLQINTSAGVELFSVGASDLVINEGGADRDLRVEGDTDVNLLSIDAGNNRVAIGSAAVSSKFAVVGTTDEPTAYILPNAAQTNDVLQIYDNASNLDVKVDSTGKLILSALQLTTGASLGYVLQSDGSGNASWVSSSTVATQFKVGYFTSPTSTGTQNVSVGFTPKLVIFFLMHPTTAGRLMFALGAASGTTGTDQWAGNIDNNTTIRHTEGSGTGYCLVWSDGATLLQRASMNAFGATYFQLNWNTVYTSGFSWGYIAAG